MRVNADGPIPASNHGRLHALDTLRFFAAAVVVFEHCMTVVPFEAGLPPVVLSLLDAHSAVAFFFVLSGYVLHLSLKKREVTLVTLQRFLIQRVFRLYPLFYVSLAMGAGALALPGLTSNPFLTANEYTAKTVLGPDHGNLVQWLMQLSMISPWTDNSFINPPMWTLVAEMRISLLFPFMSLVFRGRRLITALLIVGASFAVCPALSVMVIPTLGMIPLFFWGVLLAEHSKSLRVGGYWLPWLVCGVVIYAAGALLGRGVTGVLGHLYIAGLGAGAVMVAVVHSRALSAMLGHAKIAFLGECSYGIYILHFPLLLLIACVPVWTPDSGKAFFLAVFAVTLVLAVVLYSLVERPMIEHGRRGGRLVVGGQ